MRLLFITARPPWPGFRGDQSRPAGLIKHLRQRHEISVICQRWPGFGSSKPPPGVDLECVEIRRADLAAAALKGALGTLLGSPAPLQTTLFDQAAFRLAVRRKIRDFQPDAAVVILSRLASVLPELEGVPTILDFVDALSLNMAQRANRELWRAPLWQRESRLFDAWDGEVLDRIDRGLVVADRDRRAILNGLDSPGDVDRLGPRLLTFPFGLDDLPSERPRPAGSDEATVVLTGNLGYFPTVDGAGWFFERVWPEVRRSHSGARWILAGARPNRAIRRLAQGDGIELIADPEDLKAVLVKGTVAIAPLRSGSGTPIKILEAMSLGVPVVTTPQGADGLDELPEGAVSVAETADAFASSVAGLLNDREAADRQASTAWAWLEERHDLARLTLGFERLVEEVALG